MARDNTEVTLLNVKSPASLVSSVFSYWESLPSINGETQQKMWHCCCALGSAIDRGVHLRPYDFATEEAHQDFEDSHQKKRGKEIKLCCWGKAGKCGSGFFGHSWPIQYLIVYSVGVHKLDTTSSRQRLCLEEKTSSQTQQKFMNWVTEILSLFLLMFK